ncbi:LOW QUALITY PROTEIN: conserved hypothetical protein [Aspergillus udagawae]|uniref:Uncharacterized protein n=1 Tax=Aspergillus udagawae TaxID=91492 RepID=A0A8H3XRT6_9EURO|nr:LOW QUALITY PROTEIN: conserved hypothetical protein [Aspergillus udagawae]
MRGKLDIKDESGRTALHWAVLSRDEAVVQLLVDKGAKIDLRDNTLWYAVTTRNETVERILLDKGACLQVKDDNIDTVMQYATELCDFYVRQEKLERGEEILRQALQGYEKGIQPDKPIDTSHRVTLNHINSLAGLYRNRRLLEKAEELYQLEINGCKKASDDARTPRRMYDLGAFYTEQGKIVEAEEIYQLAIDGYGKVLGPDKEGTLSRMCDFGAFYLRQGKLEEAEKLLLQALQGYEKNIQPDKLIDISH